MKVTIKNHLNHYHVAALTSRVALANAATDRPGPLSDIVLRAVNGSRDLPADFEPMTSLKARIDGSVDTDMALYEGIARKFGKVQPDEIELEVSL